MKNLKSLLTLSVLLVGSAAAFAASHAGAPMTMPDTKKGMPAAGGAMTEGEIRKVDMDNKKLTIKHGEIKNLDMPGMTMVFR